MCNNTQHDSTYPQAPPPPRHDTKVACICVKHVLLQEMSTASLHYCEMVTALGVLAPGGSFILKAFTLFEHPTICALYLLGALFQQVHVHKPATSKPGNSETYIIGKGFKASVMSSSLS